MIYDGRKRLAHTATEAIARHGGVLLVPLSTQTRRLVADAVGRRLPVTVTVTSSTGQKATRSLSLVPFVASGKAPARRDLGQLRRADPGEDQLRIERLGRRRPRGL